MAATASAPDSASASAGGLVGEARAVRQRQAEAWRQLAADCDAKGLTAQAAETRRLIEPPAPYSIPVTLLSSKPAITEPPATASQEVRAWHEQFWQMRRANAQELYELARRCVLGRHSSLGFELMLVAAGEDPDNESVRRVLGYQKFNDGWYTPYEVRKLRAGMLWDDRFGWIAKDDLPRYEKGERPRNGRWISAEEDARLRRDIRAGWDVETEHYRIRTNHSLEAGVALGVKLERLHRVWRQMFVRYYASEADLAALFDGRPKSGLLDGDPLSIYYFRDRDDYLRALKPFSPGIEISVGYYREQSRRAYFFAGPEADDRTLYHEATHQLFHQSRTVSPEVGRRANFWIVEGIAMFMESLHPQGDGWVLGGADDIRMNAARYRLLVDGFYVPLAQLTAAGMQQIQQHPKIAVLYSQMAGLANFLVFDEEGRYRDNLVDYLALVYSGRDTPATLAQLTNTSFTDLDAAYRRFCQQQAAWIEKQPHVVPDAADGE